MLIRAGGREKHRGTVSAPAAEEEKGATPGWGSYEYPRWDDRGVGRGVGGCTYKCPGGGEIKTFTILRACAIGWISIRLFGARVRGV